MLIVFTGHRDRTTDPALLHALEKEYPLAVWMQGGAVGFDSQVKAVAIELGKQALPPITSDVFARSSIVSANVVYTVTPAYGLHGRQAPLIRNEAMVNKMALTDLLVACYDGRAKSGTGQCMNVAKRKGLTVRVVEALQ